MLSVALSLLKAGPNNIDRDDLYLRLNYYSKSIVVDLVLYCAWKLLTWFQNIVLPFDRLGTYGLAEYQIEGDGNCQVCFSSTGVHFIPCIEYIMYSGLVRLRFLAYCSQERCCFGKFYFYLLFIPVMYYVSYHHYQVLFQQLVSIYIIAVNFKNTTLMWLVLYCHYDEVCTYLAIIQQFIL